MYLKLLALLFAGAICSNCAHAQVSQKYFGRLGRSEHITQSIILNNGNRVGVGYAYNGTATSGSAAFAICTDPSDNVQWAVELASGNTDRLLDAAPTPDGGFVASGYVGATATTSFSALVMKFNSSGALLWSKTFKNTSPGEIFYKCTVVPSNGHILCCGAYNNSPNIGLSLLMDLDNSGTVLWTKTYDGNASDAMFGLTVKGADVIATGYFQTSTYYDAYLVEIDETNGNLKWARSYDYTSPINGNTGNWPQELKLVGNRLYMDVYDFNVFGVTSDQHGFLSVDTAGLNPTCLEYKHGTNAVVSSIKSFVFSPTDFYLAVSPGSAIWDIQTGTSMTAITDVIVIKLNSMNATGLVPVYTRKLGNTGEQTFHNLNLVNGNKFFALGGVANDAAKQFGTNDILKIEFDTAFPVTGSNCVANVTTPTFANPTVTTNPNFTFGSVASVTLTNTATTFTTTTVAMSVVNPCASAPVTINQYAAVTGRNTSCDNSITVDDASPFRAGDTILMIQMKGATIDSSNSSSFGNITAYNSAGNYEQNLIKSISGNTISLIYKIKRSYEIPGGLVQIVRVPFYSSYTVSQPHTCTPWNGAKGGVFAINVAGQLTLNDHIDVNGCGFRGGQPVITSQFGCNRTDYYYPATNNEGGQKGEGIATISLARRYGRGCLANGGGGGNDHNAGGGGGSNGGAGGLGGNQFYLGSCATTLGIGGVGGVGLSYSNVLNKVFLGGGGGSGHGNDNSPGPGAAGGGLIFISAGTLAGNGQTISANGADAVQCTAAAPGCQDDGRGGGGGGGAVLSSVASYTSTVSFTAKGGRGSDTYVSPNTTNVAPGGGGAGGVIWYSGSALPSGASTAVSGGNNGVLPQFSNNPYGAQPGLSGQTLSGLQFVTPVDSFKPGGGAVSFNYAIVSCNTAKFTTTSSGIASYLWSFGDGATSTQSSPTHTYPATGTYTVTLTTLDSSGCTATGSRQVIITPYNGSKKDTGFCAGQSVVLSTYAGANSYAWSPAIGLSSTTTATVTASPMVSTTYIVTVNAGPGCIFRDTFVVTVTPRARAAFFSSPSFPVPNTPIQFTNASTNATYYTWSFGDGTTSAATDPSHLYKKTGSYRVCLTASNGRACSDSVCKTVEADVRTAIGIPTAFSPNGDGFNDILFVHGGAVETMNLKIFNRWGQLVFESDNLDKGWDGKYKGKEQEMEAYAYILVATFIDGTTAQQKGNVNLLR